MLKKKSIRLVVSFGAPLLIIVGFLTAPRVAAGVFFVLIIGWLGYICPSWDDWEAK